MMKRLRAIPIRLAALWRTLIRAIVAAVRPLGHLFGAIIPKSDQDGALLLGIAFLAVGLALERLSWGFIATGVLLFALAVYPIVVNRRGGDR